VTGISFVSNIARCKWLVAPVATPIKMEQYRINDDDLDTCTSEHSLKSMSLAEWTTCEKTSLADEFSIFRMAQEQDISKIIRSPNASDEDPQTLIAKANGSKRVPAKQCFLGLTVVPSGYIQVVQVNGDVVVVPAGRYKLAPSKRLLGASWGRKYSLSENSISHGPFTMVRVQRGYIGLAKENGKPVFLDEGLHVYNTALFQFDDFKRVDAEHICHMSYNVIRVPKGYFGKIFEDNVAKLLPEGMHVVDKSVFQYKGLVTVNTSYINHGTIHIIQVPKGFVGLVLESNFPCLLPTGIHIYDSATLQFSGSKSKMDVSVTHGTINRFRVQKGEIGLAWQDNEPFLVEDPGTYMVDSATFKFVNCVKASEKLVTLGAKKIITVYSGEVGVAYYEGRLKILQSGRHAIDKAEFLFDGFMSTQQTSLRLKSKTNNKVQDLLVCDTKDLVSIGIRADVFYRVADPEKTITEVGSNNVVELVSETSIATLTNIMRSTALNQIAQSNLPSAVSEKGQQQAAQAAQALGEASAPAFMDQAHDKFIAKLHDDFMKRYGIEITNIRIEELKMMDTTLSAAISQQALTSAETESKLANIAGQTEIKTREQERDAQVRQIKAESEAQSRRIAAEGEIAQADAEAQAKKVRASGDAQRTRIDAEAEASAMKIRAEAEVTQAESAAKVARIRADASIAEANAEAESIRVKAAAEAERSKLLSKTPIAEKLALLDVYSGMVKTSNSGVKKIVYVDPSTTQAGNPLGLLTLQSLNSDLKTLSTQETAQD